MKGERKRVEIKGVIFHLLGSMMFILDQYIELWCVYGKGRREGERLEVTVQMIAETLFCTERNSKLIIKN